MKPIPSVNGLPKFLLSCILALGAKAQASEEESGWYVQFATGNAYNFPLPLRMEQEGEPELDVRRARYSTRAFDADYHAPYYAWRVGHTRMGEGWDVEHLHHKIILENPPSEVEHFAITHGFNCLFVNRAWSWLNWNLRLGSGLVLARPEISIRGRELNASGDIGDGYYFSGLAVQTELQRIWMLADLYFLSLQVKSLGAYAEVPLPGGEAKVWHLSLHGLASVGLWL